MATLAKPNKCENKRKTSSQFSHRITPGHDTNNYRALKNKVQDLIEGKEIEFDPPKTPNVITVPMPKHGQGVNVVDDECFVSSVNDLTTPLLTIKHNLL